MALLGRGLLLPGSLLLVSAALLSAALPPAFAAARGVASLLRRQPPWAGAARRPWVAPQSLLQPQPLLQLRAAARPAAAAQLVEDSSNWLDDIGLALQEPATLAAMGLSPEQAERMLRRCRKNSMHFTDFLNMVWLLNHLGGGDGKVEELAQKRTNSDRGMLEKLDEYKRVLDAMTPQERGDPDSFLPIGTKAASEQAAVVEQRGGFPAGTMEQFMEEYVMLSSMLANLGAGHNIDVTTRNALADRMALNANGQARAQRRKLIQGSKRTKTKKRRPEWMEM